MERLTRKDSFGYVNHPWEFNGINGCYDIWDEDRLGKQIDRLAAYEDTGLTPEEIKNSLDLNEIIPDINVTVDYIRDLLKAKQEGRVVVLPVETGSLIYVGRKPAIITSFFGYVRERYFHAVFYGEKNGIDIPFEEFGKTVFLTREEAEAAMAQEGGDG